MDENHPTLLAQLNEMDRENAALRAQLTERDREIERLKAELAEADMWAADHSEFVDPAFHDAIVAQLSASQARERELGAQGVIDRDEQGRLREEIRVLTESKKFATEEACRFSSLYFESQAREREAVEKLQKMQELLDILTTPNVSYFDMTPAEEIARLESALAAARKALGTAWAAMCERRGYAEAWEWKYGTTWDEEDAEVSAALNGDSHAV